MNIIIEQKKDAGFKNLCITEGTGIVCIGYVEEGRAIIVQKDTVEELILVLSAYVNKK